MKIAFTTLIGILPRGIVLLWAIIIFGASARDIFLSHDGLEYYQFAESLCDNTLKELPEGILRHDPGLPIILSIFRLLTFKLVPLIWVAVAVNFAASAILIKCLQKFINTAFPNRAQTVTVCHALALLAGYPAITYYGMINLTETVFTAALFGGLYLVLENKKAWGYVAIGIGILIRTTGVFMLLAVNIVLLLNIMRASKNNRTQAIIRFFGYNILAIVPWALWQIVSIQLTDTTSLSTHKPTLSFPFSGFIITPDISKIRLLYISLTVGFICLSVTGIIRNALRSKSDEILWQILAWYSASFLLFHLCLKSLYYIDRTVYTLNYQDRYLVPLWLPILLLFNKLINRYTVTPMVLASMAISLYWIKNYLAAAGF